MLREIYIRNDNEQKYNPNALEMNTPLEAMLAKIRMIVFTNKGDVLGNPSYGLDLEDLVFEKEFNEEEIRSEFRQQIDLYAPEASDFNVDVSITFLPGTSSDIAILDVFIDSNPVLRVETV